MAAATLPLTLGEILDRTVQLYRRSFLLLVGIAAPAAGVTMVISGSVVLLLSQQMFSVGQLGRSGKDTTQAASQAGILIALALVGFILIGIPVLLFLFSMCFSALNYAAYHATQNRKVTIRESYRYSFTHFWRHVGILFLQVLFSGIVPYFVFGAVVVIGSILAALISKTSAGDSFMPFFVIMLVGLSIGLFVACIMFWLRFSLAYPASVAENRKAWDSLKRSNQLSRESRGRIFVMFLLVWLLSIVLTLALAVPIDIAIGIAMRSSLTHGHPPAAMLTLIQGANLMAGFMVRILVMPVYAIALLLFYNDQRTRHEGFDIEQLMKQAGWLEPGTAVVPRSAGLPGNLVTPYSVHEHLAEIDAEKRPELSPLAESPAEGAGA